MLRFAILLVTCVFGRGFFESLGGGYGPEKVKQLSGYFNTNQKDGNDGHLFFWMFESRAADPMKVPLVMWLTGGPGCSSELAVFYEQGPYRISKSGDISLNPYSWNEYVNILFMDQPVGTGFSYADNNDAYCQDEDCVAEDLYEFLQHFFEAYPQYANLDFYVTGESYGGHYVPAISSKIFTSTVGMKINMKGFAVGNGLTMPAIQYGQYTNFALDNKLISQSQHDSLQRKVDTCVSLINKGAKGMFATLECNQIISGIQQIAGHFNVYDIRKPCVGSLCYDFSPLDTLMAKQEVVQALNVSSKANWAECNNNVHSKMMNDWFNNLEPKIPPMLEGGYKVLIYAGVEDFICNWYGNREWVNAMKWSGTSEYQKLNYTVWNVDQKRAGEFKRVGNLTFLALDAAGHMVPMDQPANALEMLRAFIGTGL